MEQLYLFAPPEIIKNKAIQTLAGAEFLQSEKHWRELERLDPGNAFVGAALDICRFWNDLYPDDDMLNRADPLEVFKVWREFETQLHCKEYRGNAIIGQIKENIFLRKMGLEHGSPALRESLERHGIEALDLLMEIEKWALAAKEIRMVRMMNPSRGRRRLLSQVFQSILQSREHTRVPALPTSNVLGCARSNRTARYRRFRTPQ